MARTDFLITILSNFEPQEHHHYQSNRKSNVTGVLEKDESFKRGTLSPPPRGGGILPEKLVGVHGLPPKNPTLFMTKICDFPHLIYDRTKNSKPYLIPVSVVHYNSSLVQTNVKLL